MKIMRREMHSRSCRGSKEPFSFSCEEKEKRFIGKEKETRTSRTMDANITEER